MKKLCRFVLAAGCVVVTPAGAQQVWTGIISDSACGAAHQQTASAKGLTDRQCIFECIKASAKYILVDPSGRVFPIANQGAIGLPFYTGRPVRMAGALTSGAIVVSAIEPVAAHVHLGHVMTSWGDTPEKAGLLFAAVSDADVAAVHARLADKSRDSLADMQTHAGHVLQALDPSVEPKGPASGYGVKKAATGARQHLTLAAQADGATANIRGEAATVGATLERTIARIDRAIALAQQIRAARDGDDAARLASQLLSQTAAITDDLQQARAQMERLMKAEGLGNTAR